MRTLGIPFDTLCRCNDKMDDFIDVISYFMYPHRQLASTKVTCSEWLMRIVATYRGENNWQNGLIIKVKQVYLKPPSSRSLKNPSCSWAPLKQIAIINE